MNDRNVIRERLRYASEALRRHDLMRAALVADRDSLLAEARDNGVSWVDLQADSGLSVGAVRKSLERAKKAP